MELITHDLVKLRDSRDLILDLPKPEWVDEALERAPLVVVRRAPLINNVIPVGIRGSNRDKRFAAAVLYSNIIERITPEQLAISKVWRTNKHIQETKMVNVLEFVDSILVEHGLSWGPTGSTGFELASGVPTVTENSDLDIVIRASKYLPVKTAKQLIEKLMQASIKVDIQLETPNGSVALAEYAGGGSSILLRTIYGPRLVKNPWIKDKGLEG